MMAMFLNSYLKKHSPFGSDGKPRALSADEKKNVLDALKPVMEAIAEYADKHDAFVPAFDVEAKGVHVRLTIERLPAARAACAPDKSA